MATQSDMLQSKWIQKTDLSQPTRLIIAGCSQETVKDKDGKEETKWIVTFQGGWKPMILNVTNTKAFFAALDPDSDNWAGKEIILFNDMSVNYNGDMGGIRVYQELKVAPAQAPSQFTADNNLAQNPPRTDETGPLPEPPAF
jgi:hypothetical protein